MLIEILKALLLGFSIGLTGVLVPGPILFATIKASLERGWSAGPEIIFGHMVVELIICILIFFGIVSFLANDIIPIISLIGGFSLVFFGAFTIKDARDCHFSTTMSNNLLNSKIKSNLIITGIITTVSNPYFWIWWLTISSVFVLKEYETGILASMSYILGHWVADLSWFTAVSGSLSRGKTLFSEKMHKYTLYACGIFLVIFGFNFIVNYNTFARSV